MNIKVDDITVQPDGYVHIELLVPKRRPGGTRFDGTKYKSYLYNERYKIITDGKKLYVKKHCIKDGWHSYPDSNYIKIEKWWKENKRSVKNDMIKTIRGV